MRISDWSSDVCSSDLPRMQNKHENSAPEPKPLWKRMTWLVLIWSASVLALGVVAWLLRQFMTAAGLTEIGRVSCRERVCQYRVDLGVRRIIKKKISI